MSHRKCKVVIGHEDLLIAKGNGTSEVIPNPNPIGFQQECNTKAIPVHAIHCGKAATEHHSECYARLLSGAHGGIAANNGIYKIPVNLAYCAEHNAAFIEEQIQLEVEFNETQTL